jgi:hypothetical protein
VNQPASRSAVTEDWGTAEVVFLIGIFSSSL